MKRSRKGFTLIEVLLATMILASGLVALLTCLSTCIEMISASKKVHEVQYVFDLAELEYPIKDDIKDVEEEVPVDIDSDLVEGYTFERTVDEKIDNPDIEDDGLWTVRSRVSWNYGKQFEEIVQYIRISK